MARRKKDDNVATLILIIIGAMAWGIYVAVKALINLNERFIESVSNPAGVIGLFLVQNLNCRTRKFLKKVMS